MPTMALAALVKMRLEISLRPSASTTEGIMMMSLVPTYWATLPEAMVETITLGTPTGRARMAGVAREVPPLPPMERMPSSLPRAKSSGTSFSAPRAITSMASPRSFLAASAARSTPTAAATSALLTSGVNRGSKTPVWMQRVWRPAASIRSLMYLNSFPLVSNVPRIAMVFMYSPLFSICVFAR